MNRRRRRKGVLTFLLQPTTGGVVLALVIGLGLLFYNAVQAHRLERLRQLRVELESQLEQAQQDYVRAYSAWHRAAAREVVVARAVSELGMVEPEPLPRQVVAIPGPAEEPGLPAMLAGLARSLDRFGEVRTAVAEEAGP